jgi:hypothetical protein
VFKKLFFVKKYIKIIIQILTKTSLTSVTGGRKASLCDIYIYIYIKVEAVRIWILSAVGHHHYPPPCYYGK